MELRTQTHVNGVSGDLDPTQTKDLDLGEEHVISGRCLVLIALSVFQTNLKFY